MDRGSRQSSCCARATTGVKRVTLAAAMKAATTLQEDLVRPYVDDLRNVVDMEAIRAAGLSLAVDPLGRRGGALLGADQPRLRAEHHGRESGGRPDLLVHDRRSRRQDPHGLFQPVCDGAARRAQGPVPRRVRQRPGRRPARHRDAVRRADESEPLSRGRDPVPADATARAGPAMPPSARRWSAAA